MIESPIYLASKSPRRKFLMENSGFDLRILSIDVDESYPEDLAVEKVAEYIATIKAKETALLLKKDQIGITADTIVVLDNQVLEKPKDAVHAKEMLRKLSNCIHKVYTGVVIVKNGNFTLFTVMSEVQVGPLKDEEIDFYIKKYKPFDKAGSYGIQEWFGYTQIKHINGSYTNIMGLPMYELYHQLLEVANT